MYRSIAGRVGVFASERSAAVARGERGAGDVEELGRLASLPFIAVARARDHRGALGVEIDGHRAARPRRAVAALGLSLRGRQQDQRERRGHRPMIAGRRAVVAKASCCGMATGEVPSEAGSLYRRRRDVHRATKRTRACVAGRRAARGRRGRGAAEADDRRVGLDQLASQHPDELERLFAAGRDPPCRPTGRARRHRRRRDARRLDRSRAAVAREAATGDHRRAEASGGDGARTPSRRSGSPRRVPRRAGSTRRRSPRTASGLVWACGPQRCVGGSPWSSSSAPARPRTGWVDNAGPLASTGTEHVAGGIGGSKLSSRPSEDREDGD